MAGSGLLRCTFLVLLIAGHSVWASAPADDVDEKDVVVLTTKNFETELAKEKFALVDATEEGDLANQFDVKGYPTLKWFVNGKEASDFGGGRTKDDIVRWIAKKTGPATSDVTAVDAAEKLSEKPGATVLAYLSELSGADFESYTELAASKDDTEFFTTTSKDVAAKLGLTATGSVAVIRNYEGFDPETVTSAGDSTFEGAKGSFGERAAAFLLAQRLPAYMEFSQANANAIFGSGVDKHVIVAGPEEAFAPGKELDTLLRAASAKTRGQVVLVIAKLGTETAKPILDFFGLDAAASTAQVVGFDSKSNKKFKFPGEGEVTADALAAFAVALNDGSAQALLKSAPVPEEPTEDGVTVVVGSTVDSIVKSEDHDVLLESLAPIYEKLAKRFASVDSVVIAKMDGTANEHPDIDAKVLGEGFPTLLFFPAGKAQEAIPYTDERTLKAFTKFLKANAKKKFTLPKKGKKGKKEEAAALWSRGNMGRHSQAYLLTYCGISFMGWSYALVSIIASLVVNRNVEPPSEDTSAFVETFQLLGLLDVLNAAVGLVASAPLTAFLQWAGRSNVLFGVLPLAPPEVSKSPMVTVLFAVWALADIIRFAYYASVIMGKYSAFIPLYPIGVAAEMKIVWDSIPLISKSKAYSVQVPGGHTISYAHFLWVLLLIYIPIFWRLYSFLLRQRKKKLAGSLKKKDA
ncbi:Protein disulfide isomerase-like 1-4 [Auxenochlorella protothecoides]|uniref:very-long-chain (3R)-3-hydroxyacyl-CoA dehydratase n=1 Tax=Auxenochlorella protothecoides TaxID=3075 RepID=A0A087STY6_AUXPR|nr:Protein disulfide isomerase-like 1-4 [Auxenochlorella protothecoides]KFM29190.1 Protein disulfide isomerase-like 1-4 [Auxenochlorella protothecoides]